MKSKDTKTNKTKGVVTRDMPSKGESAMTTYDFPSLKVSGIRATSLQEAQLKAEAKAKALNN